jgi:hypothetical protein
LKIKGKVVIKWFRIYGNYFCGVWPAGCAFFLIQELPYAVMPFLSLPANVLMEMEIGRPVFEIMEKIFGVLTVVLLVLLVNGKSERFPFGTWRDKSFFIFAMLFLSAYFTGWYFYFTGHQSVALILSLLVAPPPLYYMSLGLWKKHCPLVVVSAIFLIFHLANVWTNLTN